MTFWRISVLYAVVAALSAVSLLPAGAQESGADEPPFIPRPGDFFDEEGNLDPRDYLDRLNPGDDRNRPQPPDRGDLDGGNRDRPQPPDRGDGDDDGRDDRDRDDRDPRDGEYQRGPSPYLVPPPNPRRGDRWRLGVYTEDTPTGVIVTSVIRDTPAWDAGLEEGDTIVTVNGYQVGYIDRRLYPLGEELQRRAGRNGRVTLLVQNRRNGRLVNVDVQLERALR